MQFQQRLKETMEKKGVSNYRLAKEICISKSTVANWLNGLSFPDGMRLSEIADYLDCSVDYLLGRTDNPEVNR